MKNIYLYLILSLAAVSLLVGGFGLANKNNSTLANPLVASPGKIISTGYQNPHGKDLGIGPVKNVKLSSTIDTKMVAEGKSLFNNKCSVCHEMNQKKVGPPLKDITKQRTPEFIMNLLLNTTQMQKDDPAVEKLLKEYNNIPMPDPGLNREQARAVLEYLRSVAK